MSWALMLTHNGREMSRRAIETVLKQQNVGEMKLLVIDNDSKDGTQDMLRGYWPRVMMIVNQPARGVSTSWNRGLKLLLDSGGEKVLVVNNDVELHPLTFRYLIDANLPFVTCVSVGSREQLSNTPPDYSKNRPHPDFSCFMISKECFDKVGEFDEMFEGAYCEDGDYHLRMHKAGIDAQCIDFPFFHIASGTIKSASPREGDDIHKQAERNRKLFEDKWGFKMGSPEYYAAFNSH